jgi:hypothetical protein
MADPSDENKFIIDVENSARVYRSGHGYNESTLIKGGVFDVR